MPKFSLAGIFILNISKMVAQKVQREESDMSSNISALRALADLNKLAEARNSNTEPAQAERKPKFSLFGFGFRTSAAEDVPPEEKGFTVKT